MYVRFTAAISLVNAGAKEQLQRLEAIMNAAEVIVARGWMSKVRHLRNHFLFLVQLLPIDFSTMLRA